MKRCSSCLEDFSAWEIDCPRCGRRLEDKDEDEPILSPAFDPRGRSLFDAAEGQVPAKPKDPLKRLASLLPSPKDPGRQGPDR